LIEANINDELSTLLSYLALLYVFTSIIIASFIKRESYQTYDDNYEVVSKETIEKLLKSVYKSMLQFRMYMKRVISLDDLFLTIRFFGFLLGILTIADWFSESFLAFIYINAIFVWNPIKTKYGDEIEKYVEDSKSRCLEYLEMIKSVIPKYVDKN